MSAAARVLSVGTMCVISSGDHQVSGRLREATRKISIFVTFRHAVDKRASRDLMTLCAYITSNEFFPCRMHWQSARTRAYLVTGEVISYSTLAKGPKVDDSKRSR